MSAKVAARKIRGGRIRGMKVLAHMNTARWNSMNTADREEATQCPCQGGMQNVEHVVSECDYMVTYLDEMVDTVDTVDSALRSESGIVRVKWMEARNMGEKVAAVVGTDMRRVSPDALSEVATGLKLLVRRAEKALRTVNKAGESWPVAHGQLGSMGTGQRRAADRDPERCDVIRRPTSSGGLTAIS